MIQIMSTFQLCYLFSIYRFPLKSFSLKLVCLKKKKKQSICEFLKIWILPNACQSILNFSNKYSQLRAGAEAEDGTDLLVRTFLNLS